MKRILLLALALLASQANAGIISADFVSRADNLALGGPVRELRTLNQSVGAGLELGENALDTSPVPWDTGVLSGMVYLDLDPTTYRLTLSSLDFLDVDSFTASIGNIQFSGLERITGLGLVSDRLAKDFDSEDFIVPTFTFTDNSLEIQYSADIDAYEYFNLVAGGEAVFQLQTSAGAPEIGRAHV